MSELKSWRFGLGCSMLCTECHASLCWNQKMYLLKLGNRLIKDQTVLVFMNQASFVCWFVFKKRDEIIITATNALFWVNFLVCFFVCTPLYSHTLFYFTLFYYLYGYLRIPIRITWHHLSGILNTKLKLRHWIGEYELFKIWRQSNKLSGQTTQRKYKYR